MSIDLINENGFTLKRQAETMTDADYGDDLGFLTNLLKVNPCCID